MPSRNTVQKGRFLLGNCFRACRTVDGENADRGRGVRGSDQYRGNTKLQMAQITQTPSPRILRHRKPPVRKIVIKSNQAHMTSPIGLITWYSRVT
jgi:hypothetical protein